MAVIALVPTLPWFTHRCVVVNDNKACFCHSACYTDKGGGTKVRDLFLNTILSLSNVRFVAT